MQKFCIRLTTSILDRLDWYAAKTGLTKTQLVQGWLNDIPYNIYFLHRSQILAKTKKSTLTFYLDEATQIKIRSILISQKTSMTALLDMVLIYHLEFKPDSIKRNSQQVVMPQFLTLLTEMTKIDTTIKGKDELLIFYEKLSNQSSSCCITNSTLFEDIFPDNFYDFILAGKKGVQTHWDLTEKDEKSRNFYEKALAIWPGYKRNHKFSPKILPPGIVDIIATDTELIVVEAGQRPVLRMTSHQPTVEYANSTFKYLWQTN